MPVMGVSKFERFFRKAASLDVDKDDLKRYNDFIDNALYRLLVRGEANAEANARDVIQRWDLPITAGLQERIHEFRDLDEEIELAPILEQITALPPLSLALSQDAHDRLPELVGGLSVALARTIAVHDPGRTNPQSEDWERAVRIFELLL
ncbi:MAG: hypothetical protein QOI54_290 [Actinomycetota bacterium]|jgi:hypothetical protein|nr:hypothetical protein [Actinomycetota bacterium]